MANTFLRKTSNNIGTSFTTVYTVPASTTAVVIGGVIANISTTTAINGEVVINDGTNDINMTGVDTPIPTGTSLSFIDGKVVMQAGDVLKVKSSLANNMDVHISIMEIS